MTPKSPVLLHLETLTAGDHVIVAWPDGTWDEAIYRAPAADGWACIEFDGGVTNEVPPEWLEAA